MVRALALSASGQQNSSVWKLEYRAEYLTPSRARVPQSLASNREVCSLVILRDGELSIPEF